MSYQAVIRDSVGLHVEGKVRIADSTQGNNKMLGSDAGGTASWVGTHGKPYFRAFSGRPSPPRARRAK